MRVTPTQLKSLDVAERAHPVRANSRPGKTQHDQLTDHARKWVSQTFFGTLLKQMGDSTFKSDLFSGGRGGEAFSSLYHQQLADRMARGAGDALVQSIVRRIEAQAAYRNQATKSNTTTNPKRVGDVPVAARA